MAPVSAARYRRPAGLVLLARAHRHRPAATILEWGLR